MTIERGDGFYLGPLCINYGFVAFVFVAPILIFGVAGYLPLTASIIVATIGALALPVLLYQYAWALWLTTYYLCLPEELHANRDEDDDDLSFDEEIRR